MSTNIQNMPYYRGKLQVNRNLLLKNEDAVSIAMGFILMLSITVLVFSAIVLSFYTLTQHSKEASMMESFDILGSRFAIKVSSMDTLVNITTSNGGIVNKLEYDFSIPAYVVNEGCGINITREKIFLNAENDAKSWIPFNSSHNITEQIYSSDYTLGYDNVNNSMKIEQQ